MYNFFWVTKLTYHTLNILHSSRPVLWAKSNFISPKAPASRLVLLHQKWLLIKNSQAQYSKCYHTVTQAVNMSSDSNLLSGTMTWLGLKMAISLKSLLIDKRIKQEDMQIYSAVYSLRITEVFFLTERL